MQQKVYNDVFSSDDVRGSYTYRCKPGSGKRVLRFCLCGFFNMPEAAEEYPPHYRQHGMCSKCKEKNDRRLVRHKERLEGIARFNQAEENNDEEGIDEHMRWCAVESDYGELSEHAPNEHEVMEMVNDYNELLNSKMYDDEENGRDPGLRLQARADGAA